MVKKLKKLQRTGIVAAALAELQKEKVAEATTQLKKLYAQLDKAKKVVRNLEREIEDYIQELEIDDADDSKSSD